MLYSVQLRDGTAVYIYALLEHKSYPDPDTPFQLLRYMVRIWERDQRKKEGLRPIIPIVLYHGQSCWQIPTDFAEMFTGTAPFRPYWPQFQYEIKDLSTFSESEIRGRADLQIAMLVLKYIMEPALRQRLGDIIGLFSDLAKTETALEYLKTVLYYIGKASKYLQAEDVTMIVQQALQDEENELLQAVAEHWIEQGIEQGFEKGIEKGIEQGQLQEKRAIARKLLGLHEAIAVSELSGLPLDEVLALQEDAS